MKFETDQQTLKDLNILGKFKNGSIFNMFGATVTRGGEQIMEKMFVNPLTDVDAINKRSSIFKFFTENDFAFPFSSNEFDEIDQYVSSGGKSLWINFTSDIYIRAMKDIGHTPEYDILYNRTKLILQFLNRALTYFKLLKEKVGDNEFKPIAENGYNLCSSKNFIEVLKYKDSKDLSFLILLKIDTLLRCQSISILKELVDLLCIVDVNTTVGAVARENDFCYAKAEKDSDMIFDAHDLWHPTVKGAIANDIRISKKSNLFFLTGANMAGKSTLMKAFGLGVYMAHMGFPIAAKSLKFILRDGVYTSINLPDDIDKGYSHFYAEVLRVKHFAIEVSKSKKLIVILDELFKGTNVKDAFDATYAVTRALIDRKECAYMISTHITEVGDKLREECKNIDFQYLPTVMKGSIPTYTYKLREGITADKHGMLIINNEKIIDIINGKINV
ncbi:MAG: hypothetical protein WCR33_02315 [Bacilli bacterium]